MKFFKCYRIFRACKIGNPEKVLHLLTQCPESINYRNPGGSTPLHTAVRYNNVETIQLLIEYGAAINSHDNFHRTALDIAISLENFEAADQLLMNGACRQKDFWNKRVEKIDLVLSPKK